MPDIGDFIRRSRRSAKIAIASPGDFRRSPQSAYKIARCVAGLRKSYYCDILLKEEGWGWGGGCELFPDFFVTAEVFYIGEIICSR